MRVIKTLLTSLTIIFILVALGFLAMREILLLTTLSQVRRSLVQVRDADINQSHLTDCMNRGANRDERGRMHHTQLRFVDDNSYVLEVVCNAMEHNPIEFGSGELPQLVTPLPGQSGIRWGVDAGLNFNCFNRVGSISVLDGVFRTSLNPSIIVDFTGPSSNCRSYGYYCCDVDTQVGKGELMAEALDCPKTCYPECLDRPIILSFNTQPYYDRLTRTLEIGRNQAVTFSYMVAPDQEASFIYYEESDDPVENAIIMIESLFMGRQEEEPVLVVLDYGDGTSDQFTGLRGQVQHVYQCAQDECDYAARLNVVKNNGVESMDGLQNKINVRVR